MTTSREQASINIARQIDDMRKRLSVTSPEIAAVINDAIASELANQASGFRTTRRIKSGSAGFGDVDLSSAFDVLSSDPTVFDSAAPNFTFNAPELFDVSNIDLSGLSNLFGSAGSSATPLLSNTSIAGNGTSIDGVLNSISNTFTSAVKAIYAPQVAIAQTKAQLATIQAQAQATQLGLLAPYTQQRTLSNLLLIGGLGALAIFALEAVSHAGDKVSSTTTTSRRNH